jgi:hypothetical protein
VQIRNIYGTIIVLSLLIAFPLQADDLRDEGDGTVSALATNLLWQKCSAGQNNDSLCSGSALAFNWVNALNYCKNLSLAGKAWRLPSVTELRSIIDRDRSVQPFIDLAVFPATINSVYWTSTTWAGNPGSAWIVNFGRAASGPDQKTTAYYVRCVSTRP